jgi:hypothetical protein
MGLVYAFRNEIEQIQDERLREFLVESLDCIPEFYETMNSFIEETQRAFKYAMILAEEMDSSDVVLDIIGISALLQDCTKYDYLNDGQGNWYTEENLVHPLTVRTTLAPMQGIIGRDMFDDIMRVIEGSHGFNSPIPQVMPEYNSPAQLWILPFANRLAKEVT